jgi:hypothetical protein
MLERPVCEEGMLLSGEQIVNIQEILSELDAEIGRLQRVRGLLSGTNGVDQPFVIACVVLMSSLLIVLLAMSRLRRIAPSTI